MIFSLLNVRKKTSATLAGIAIAGLCLWGLAAWQDIQIGELLRILAAIVLMIIVIMLAAATVIFVFKLLLKAVRKLSGKK